MATNYPWSTLTYATPYPATSTNPYYSPYGVSSNAPSTIVWVAGELGAKNYPIAPNTSVLLMDSESSKFYIKSADLLGVQSIRSYEYSEMTGVVEPENVEEIKPTESSKSDYVSRKEFEELKKTIDELMD